MKQTTRLRELLGNSKAQIAPGVFDGLSARLVEQAGFSAIYASGGAIARSNGYPDMGILDLNSVLNRLEHIVKVTQIPVIADMDTGFENITETTRKFVELGLAACHIEDQVFPKRCGHLDGKSLVSSDEMVERIAEAKAAIIDPDFVLIARTDAIAVEGFEAAIARANDYMRAGADMIFVEAPETEAQIKAIGERVHGPKLINMFAGGKTPMVDHSRLEDWGYNFIIIPSDLQRAAIKAMQDTLQVISNDGDSRQILERLTSFTEREKIVKS